MQKTTEMKIFDLATRSAIDPTQKDLYNELPHLVQQYFDNSQPNRRKHFAFRHEGIVVPNGTIHIREYHGVLYDAWQINYQVLGKGSLSLRTSVYPGVSNDQFFCVNYDSRNTLSEQTYFRRKFIFGQEVNTSMD